MYDTHGILEWCLLLNLQVRVPLADSTVMKAPEDIADNALVLMADIWPTLVIHFRWIFIRC